MGIGSTRVLLRLWFLMIGASVGVSAAQGTETPCRVAIPGSRAGLDRLLPVSSGGGEEYLANLNRSLLETVREDGDWRAQPRRALLDEYLTAVREIRSRLHPPLRIPAGTRGHDRRFREMSEILGYRSRPGREGLVLQPREGDQWKRRRSVARAIGWDPPALLQQLADHPSESVLVLTLEDEYVPSPIPFDLLSRILGEQIDSGNFLVHLAHDQNFGLFMEGYARCPLGMRAALDVADLRRIYQRLAVPFYRYVSGFEVRDGKLDPPGGVRAARLWTELTDAPLSSPDLLLISLLGKDGGRGAFLWHSLHFAPENMVDYMLFGGRAGSNGKPQASLRRLFRRLARSADNDRFEWPRGRRQGFAAFLRSVPVSSDGSHLRLSGGLGVWLQAIKGSGGPSSERKLTRIASRGERRELEEEEFLFKALTESVKIGKVRLLALPRIVRISNLWDADEELLTPRNVVLLARATELYPGLLQSIENLPLSGAESVEKLLLTVRRLDGLRDDADKFVLIASFQGGLELLANLHLAHPFQHAEIARLLESWVELHENARDPKDVGSRQLEWLGNLVAALPPADETFPGRGPKERALLQMLSPWEDPQVFSFRGMEYEGHRQRQLAAAWMGIAKQQSIPSLDELDGIREGLAALDGALSSGDLKRSQALAGTLVTLIEGLPSPHFEQDLRRKEEKQFAPVERERVVKLLRRIERQTKAKKLPKQRTSLGKVRALMAREIRPFLLAGSYFIAAGEDPPPLLADLNLIRKHSMVRNLEKKLRPNPLIDSPWIEARVVPASEGRTGLRIAGYVGTVGRAMEEYQGKAAAMGQEAGGGLSALNRRLEPGCWSAIRPEISRLVAASVALGNAVLVAARDQTEENSLAHRLVLDQLPTARLPRAFESENPEGVITVSERMSLGVRALEAAAAGASGCDYCENPRLRDLREAISEAGEGWREELRTLGPPAPHLNGRHHSGLLGLPPYEGLVDEGSLDALWERAAVDLYLEILTYIGRHGLPAVVASDLHERVLRRHLVGVGWGGSRDWQTFAGWLAGLSNGVLDKEMRACQKEALYTLRLH